MESKRPDRMTLLAFAVTVLLGGNNAIAVRFSNAELPPFFGAAVRFGLAALILFVFVYILRLKLPRGRNLLGVVIFGILAFGLNYALLYWSLQYMQAGLTMVLLALTPLLTFLFAVAHRQESFRWQGLIGAGLAIAGVGWIFWEQLQTNIPFLPMLGVIAAAACFAEATVVVKSFPRSHPITTNAVALTIGTALLFLFSAIKGEDPVMPSARFTWAALVYLIVFGSVSTFVLSLYVIARWTASASSYQFVLFPIVTLSVGVWLADEKVSITVLFGGLLVMAGVIIGGILKPDHWETLLGSGRKASKIEKVERRL